MQTFTYPASDLDNREALLDVLGSFWSRTYTGIDQLNSYTQATAAGVAQTQLNLLETIAALSRFDIPIFHTENWHPIVLRKSDTNITAFNQYKFDENSFIFDGNPQIQFDEFTGRDFFVFPLPDKLQTAAKLFDRLLFPTFALSGGIDFVVDADNQVILFVTDPFASNSVIRRPIYDGDKLVDEEITLWAFKAQFDYQYVFQQFAYAVDINLKSSENTKKLVNAVLDGLLAGGASVTVLNKAFAAIFDIPVVETGGEIVEVMTVDNDGLFIATDRAIYRFDAAAVPVVAVGDVLRQGDRLVDVFAVFEINSGAVSSDITALALDSGFTAACFYGDLIFENKDVPVLVNTNHPSGYTYISFALGGLPSDIQRFFDELHARGIEQIPQTPPECSQPGTNKRLGTLAQILDRRKTPIGEPTADDLPQTINPLQFLVKNVFRNNAVIARVQVSQLGKNQLGLYNIRHVRQLLPPGSALFLIYAINSQIQQITADEFVLEDTALFKAGEPLTDAVASSLVTDRGVIVRTVSGTCQ
jgi:hypothetical protein